MSIINDIMNPSNLLEVDDKQFRVQPVNHDNECDCDGMCCSDCTVVDCPIRDCKVIVRHM